MGGNVALQSSQLRVLDPVAYAAILAFECENGTELWEVYLSTCSCLNFWIRGIGDDYFWKEACKNSVTIRC
jgi:hypothetical protein